MNALIVVPLLCFTGAVIGVVDGVNIKKAVIQRAKQQGRTSAAVLVNVVRPAAQRQPKMEKVLRQRTDVAWSSKTGVGRIASPEVDAAVSGAEGDDCLKVPDFAKNTFPPYWGPRVWKALHCIAANYDPAPNDDLKQSADEFLKSLPFLLPCGYCGWHLHNQIEEHTRPVIVASRSNMVKFFVEAHNNITEHNNKNASLPATIKKTWDVTEAENYYDESFCSGENVTWDALHLIAVSFHVPEGESWTDSYEHSLEIYRFRFKRFIEALPSMLPRAIDREGFRNFISGKPLDTIVASKIRLNQFFADVHKQINRDTEISSANKAKNVYLEGWKTACVHEQRLWEQINIYADVTDPAQFCNYLQYLDGGCPNGMSPSCAGDAKLGPVCK